MYAASTGNQNQSNTMNKAMNSLFDVVGFWDHFGSPVCTVHQEQEQISTDQ